MAGRYSVLLPLFFKFLLLLLLPERFSLAILAMEVNLVSAEFALRESLPKENSPLENLGKVHHTVKWQKNYFITFGLILQKASSGQKNLGKNQRRHVFFKMTGSAISGLAVTMSAADTRFTSIAKIARENRYEYIMQSNGKKFIL